jgi:hypothetical protein
LPTRRRRYDELDIPTDPTMAAPLNEAPRYGHPRPAAYRSNPRYQDLVIPRVVVEPDEQMDALRARSLRWGIARDVVVVAVGLYLIGAWALPPIMRFLGFSG